MRYASIREMDVSNGYGVGVSLFTQGCHFHCKNCFNQVTWDFNGGKEYTESTENKIRELVNRPYIHRFSVLGGEPIEQANIMDLTKLLMHIKRDADNQFKEMDIWLYTGYSLTEIIFNAIIMRDRSPKTGIYDIKKTNITFWDYVMSMLYFVDHLVDGRYEEDKKDYHLKFCGSSNQRIIDMKKTHENYMNDPNIPKIMANCDCLNAAEIMTIEQYINKNVIVEIDQKSL